MPMVQSISMEAARLKALEDRLLVLADPDRRDTLISFFKCGPGEYGEGDRFMGVPVPRLRALVKELWKKLDLDDCRILLGSSWHESRLVALLVMEKKYAMADTGLIQQEIVSLYEAHFDRINNWDLVDASAPKITGPWYLGRDRSPLLAWALSGHLWTQRIAIMTTFAFIRSNDYSTTLELADMLKNHPHDLMHKAVGWMLREVGNRSPQTERDWLASRYKTLPRTMLRYAIEKFPKDEYQDWLEGRI